MIYAIPFSMSCAQLYNAVAYTKLVNNRLGIVDKEIGSTLAKNAVFGIMLVLLNYLFRNDFILQAYTNFFLICMWLIFEGREVIMIFRLLTQKSEIK